MFDTAHRADHILMTPGDTAARAAIRAISTPVVATELRSIATVLEALGDAFGVATAAARAARHAYQGAAAYLRARIQTIELAGADRA
jgi:hypothetical protein